MGLLEKVSLLVTPNAVKAGKLYSVIPSSGTGDLTSTRNTTKTRKNSSGLIETVAANVPSLNYDTVGGAPSILVESQRTNLSAFSEELSDSSYIKTEVTISSNTFTSPSGVLNADKITPSTNSSFHTVARNTTVASGVVVTFSVFAKRNGYNFLLLNTDVGSTAGNSGPVINLLNGTVAGFLGSTNYNAKVVSYPNDWYRIDMQITTSDTFIKIDLNTLPSSAINAYSGDGTSGVLIWGYSLEVGNSVSSYIPTTTSAAVTRNSDIITVSTPTGTVKITTTFSDNTTQVLTSIPATFTIPEGLIKQVLMQSSL